MSPDTVLYLKHSYSIEFRSGTAMIPDLIRMSFIQPDSQICKSLVLEIASDGQVLMAREICDNVKYLLLRPLV